MGRSRKVLYRSSIFALLIFAFSLCFNPYAAQAATKPAAEVILYTGDTVVNSANLESDLKAALAKQGVDVSQVKYTNALTTQFSVTDSFAWTVFDHTGNWGEDPYPNGDESPNGPKANKHIIIKNNGKNLTFYGYGQPAYKDFMFMANNVGESKKTFTFDLNESGIKYHSMEGGGFLFNSKLDNGVLSGYCILFDQNGMELFEISGVNADAFHNQEDAQMSDIEGIKLLKNFGKPASKTHAIKIEVTPEQLDLWDNGQQTVTAYKLPTAYGSGFGPIASHNPHDCNELSYFTFDNLQMSQTLILTRNNVLSTAKWTGCNKYLINLDDKLVPELADAQSASQILASLNKDGVYYLGWGTEVNKQQALDFVQKNSNRGAFISNTDYAKAVEETAKLIVDKLKADVAQVKASLTPGLTQGDSAGSITKNLTLPNSSEPCTTITWSSSNPSVISTSGVVTRQDSGDQQVTLTATIVKAGISESKQFSYTVKQRVTLVKTGSPFDVVTLSLLGIVLVLAGAGTLKFKKV